MRYLLLIMFVGILASSAIAGLDWQVAEIGGADSEQGPYGGGTVKFIGDDGFTITAKGGDIWGNKLGCTLAYIKGVVGDFTVQYTVEEHTGDPPATWTKVGVMVAQDIKADTPYVFLASMPSNDKTALNDKGTKLVTRAERGGGAGPGSNGWAPLKWPVPYKLVRKGDLFTCSLSFDGGTAWQSIAKGDKKDNTTVAFKGAVVVGIAINGHNAGKTTGTARVTNITIRGDGVPGGSTAVEVHGKLATRWGDLKTKR